MKYYIFSFIVSIIIFIVIQYIEYNKRNQDEFQEPFNLFTLANLLLFIIIYLVITIGLFYLNASNINLFSFLELNNKINTKGENTINQEIKDDIDPKILSKINDNFDTGFIPFTSDDDSSSLSSISSYNSKVI